MENCISKLKNWYWYHKTHLLIAVLAAAVLIYMAAQDWGVPEPDYHIGLVSTAAWSDASLAQLEAALAAQGEDQDGDGQVLVKLHRFPVDLSDTSEAAGSYSYESIAALDADLVGGVSGMFLLENPEAFQQAANGILAEPFASFDGRVYLCLRADAGERYVRLYEKLR